MSGFTIGTDGEVLFSDEHGKFVSAVGKIPGTKDAPAKTKNGIIHVDCVAGEFATKPASSWKELSDQVDIMLSDLRKITGAKGLHLSESAVGEYSQEDLSHPEAKRGGCEPDYNAYMMGEENPPPPMSETSLRCAGGHVHIGYELNKEECLKLIKTLDLMVTIPMLKHEIPHRRRLYGKAGAFRIKPYGVEYRTPSNFWLFTEERRKWMYERVSEALKCFRDFVLPPNVDTIINSHDLDASAYLIDTYNLKEIPV